MYNASINITSCCLKFIFIVEPCCVLNLFQCFVIHCMWFELVQHLTHSHSTRCQEVPSKHWLPGDRQFGRSYINTALIVIIIIIIIIIPVRI